MKGALERMQAVIEKDRTNGDGDLRALIRRDLREVLDCYFVLKGDVQVRISGGKSGTVVEICAKAERLRPIGFLPER